MKRVNRTNFFRYTYCEFQEVKLDAIHEEIAHFISKSKSKYYYTEKGVYRYSNHWGRVANCRWKLNTLSEYKTQKFHLGYASWHAFYKLDDTQKQFFITVDYSTSKVNYHHQASTESNYFCYTAISAQQRVKKIRYLLQDSKWARHYDTPIDQLRIKIISEYITTNQTLAQIKLKYR